MERERLFALVDAGFTAAQIAEIDRLFYSKNPATAQPEAPATAQPEAPATAQPEAPATAQPEAPATAQPEARQENGGVLAALLAKVEKLTKAVQAGNIAATQQPQQETPESIISGFLGNK